MEDGCFRALEKTLPETYCSQGRNARKTHSNLIKDFLERKRLPLEGWDQITLNLLLQELSLMDSNNFLGNAGVGEREGRIICPLVKQRHYGLAHGIGRSGDIAAVQPKAAGSSLVMKAANSLALDVIQKCGAPLARAAFVVPVATGMALLLCMLKLRQVRPPTATHVLFMRIDQKSCIKSMAAAGLQAVVIEPVIVGDELQTDMTAVNETVARIGCDNILCILATTSCFAPRAVDKVEELAVLCKDKDVPLLVNNAYGVQLSKCMHVIQQGMRTGRIDAFVQSCDKNFMVPVGGAIIAGHDGKFIEEIAKSYPGRGSGTPSLDLLITFLSLGWKGYELLLKERKEMYKYLKSELTTCLSAYGGRVLDTPNNPISIAFTAPCAESLPGGITEFGSMMFVRNISGLRAIKCTDVKDICGHTYTGFGSHCEAYHTPYLTAAAAVGMTRKDVDTFTGTLAKALAKCQKKVSQAPPSVSDRTVDEK